jgi:hypothetical protein
VRQITTIQFDCISSVKAARDGALWTAAGRYSDWHRIAVLTLTRRGEIETMLAPFDDHVERS